MRDRSGISWTPATLDDLVAIAKECPSEDEMEILLALTVACVSFGADNDSFAPKCEPLRELALLCIPAHKSGMTEEELIAKWSAEKWRMSCPDRTWVRDALRAFDKAKHSWDDEMYWKKSYHEQVWKK